MAADPLDEAIADDAASARLRAAGSICMVVGKARRSATGCAKPEAGRELGLHGREKYRDRLFYYFLFPAIIRDLEPATKLRRIGA